MFCSDSGVAPESAVVHSQAFLNGLGFCGSANANQAAGEEGP